MTFYENDSFQGERWSQTAVMGVSEGRMIRLKVQRREPLREELLVFSEAVRDGNEPRVSGEDALRALSQAHQLIAAAAPLSETTIPYQTESLAIPAVIEQ